MWTTLTVKDQLPPVRVQVGKTVHTGYLAGRQKRFPTVYYGPFSGTMARNEWSWDAIVRSLNTNTPLIA